MFRILSFALLIFIIGIGYGCYLDESTCDERILEEGESFVCVCDGEYCDRFTDSDVASAGTSTGNYRVISSSREKYRFHIQDGTLERTENEDTSSKIEIDYKNRRQNIIGFGGAFSDAAGIAIQSLSKEGQQKLLSSYFGKDGIEYNMGRIPIGGTDFSTHPYTYDDVEGDVELKHFKLTKEDFQFKIPLIKAAKNLTQNKIRLFASAWSPPAWMKENNKINGKGGLLKDMVDPFTKYIIKFIRAYEEHEIQLWGLTTINEPFAGFQDWPWNNCAFSAEDTHNWVKNSLGPSLEKENLRYLKLMLYECNRNALPSYPAVTLNDPEAAKYVDGISVHWYKDRTVGPDVLDETHAMFPDKFLIYTEACEGYDASEDKKVILGSWIRAENYASNIIEDLNHEVSGWVDWNIALDIIGGPNWVKNYVDAPIIVNKDKNEFYKQPMFYALGHFSKFIPEGSKRLVTKVTGKNKNIEAVAIARPDGSYAIVLLNKSELSQRISIKTENESYVNIAVEPKSINTILYSS